jgi:DNA-binding MurR/RpiR family transcriptional regulator
MSEVSFDERLASRIDGMGPAEQRAARVFQENREETLYASASALAAKAKVSDATVVRAARSLGFEGLDDLRRALATELKDTLTIASRLSETLREVGDDLASAFQLTLGVHIESLERLRREIAPGLFREAVETICGANRVVIFGIGPSSMMAEYFAIQLGRFGLDALALTRTGLLFADDLRGLRAGDALIALAYGQLYRELAALIDHAERLGLRKILVTDTLAAKLRLHVDLVLPVARGRADMLSMHTATLGLIEALLVGIGAKRPQATLESLEDLNRLRKAVVGAPADLAATRKRR